MPIHESRRSLLPAPHGRRSTGRALARLCALGTLLLGGVAACDAVSEPDLSGRAALATETGSIGGTVASVSGEPIAGATVRTAGGAATTTSAGGTFQIGGLAAAARLPVTVEAPGYASTTKVYQVVAGQTLTRPIRLQPLAAPVVISAGAGGVVPFAGGGQVTIPANAFAGVSPGDPVTVRATYIDPSSAAQLATAPGDFTARGFDGSSARLESFGMLDVDARGPQGQRLELASGQRATISFPLRGGTGAATRGFWSFDPQQAVWVEEGTATVTPTALTTTTPTVARPKNVDDRIPQVCIQVRVLRADNVTPRPFEFVSANGISYSGNTQGWTNTQGLVSLQVRAASQVSVAAGPVAQTVTTPATATGCPLVATLAF
ncbi:MAG: carboxypeptidase-like regulatory domain-containing protein [Longimicrobiaceae bacterium]